MESLLRMSEVEKRCGIKRMQIDRYVAAGKFPKPVKISKRYVAWPESEISAWVEEQIAQCRAA